MAEYIYIYIYKQRPGPERRPSTPKRRSRTLFKEIVSVSCVSLFLSFDSQKQIRQVVLCNLTQTRKLEQREQLK